MPLLFHSVGLSCQSAGGAEKSPLRGRPAVRQIVPWWKADTTPPPRVGVDPLGSGRHTPADPRACLIRVRPLPRGPGPMAGGKGAMHPSRMFMQRD
jgi:hypothetical protein